MKKDREKLIIIVSLLLIVVLFGCYYIFNIYETTIETVPKDLYAGSQSVVDISIAPVNAFGFKIPFRKIYASFEITEGKELVEIVKEDDQHGILRLRAMEKTGKVVVYIKSAYSFLPAMVVINIYPNRA